VLKDLISSEKLKKGNYKIIHQDSEDPRGIDVALIYRTDEVNYISHQYILIPKNDTMKLRTRDILYFKYTTIKNDTIHLFVNHWPSRLGGEEASQYKRLWVAQQLKNYSDSLLKVSPKAAVIITGDFNDYPINKSISEVLNATGNNKSRSHKLLNLMYKEHLEKKGSYYFNKEWGCLDQFIVSFSVVRKKNNLKLAYKNHWIYYKDWLLQKNKKEEFYPFKTFSGKNYLGGYSDHLPIYLDIKIK
jgi:predicted extracellular nuclease